MFATPVESSTLTSVAYDPAGAVLRLEFRSHEFYLYFDVPPDVYQALLEAESKGSCFNRHLRGRFRYLRLPRTIEA